VLAQMIGNMLMVDLPFAYDVAVRLFTVNMLPEGTELVIKYCSG
jgi:hypothetical protein